MVWLKRLPWLPGAVLALGLWVWAFARFDFADTTRGADGTLTFECWPRFPRVGADGTPTQYPGWPVQVPIK